MLNIYLLVRIWNVKKKKYLIQRYVQGVVLESAFTVEGVEIVCTLVHLAQFRKWCVTNKKKNTTHTAGVTEGCLHTHILKYLGVLSVTDSAFQHHR